MLRAPDLLGDAETAGKPVSRHGGGCGGGMADDTLAGRQAGQASQGWKGWDHSWPSVVDEHLGREGHGSPSPHAATAALLLLLPPHEHVSFCHGLDPASGSGGGATQGLSLRQVDG